MQGKKRECSRKVQIHARLSLWSIRWSLVPGKGVILSLPLSPSLPLSLSFPLSLSLSLLPSLSLSPSLPLSLPSLVSLSHVCSASKSHTPSSVSLPYILSRTIHFRRTSVQGLVLHYGKNVKIVESYIYYIFNLKNY